ncbi:MAG: glucosyltransferase domain-containing protein [Lachnospiraceae bacterium]|nr:glucosyltransferase domain-containing protein [Lachnospiraceae bacterium]
MEQWKSRMGIFLKNKFYMLSLGLIALASYGFFVTHPTMGIDDTPYAYYFQEGLAAIVGRWCLFLLGKVVHIGEFVPFLPDLAAVLLLMLAAVVWSSLFYSVLQEQIPLWGYLIFGGLFISNSLHSEVLTYYLHNGIGIGYLFVGLSLICMKEGLDRLQSSEKKGMVSNLLPYGGAAVTMTVAMGCYESFMIVWLVGFLLLLLLERHAGVERKVFQVLCIGEVVALVGMLLRSLTIEAVIAIFDLGYLRDDAQLRSISEMLSWVVQENGFAYFMMQMKQTIVMYVIFAYAYYPIKIYVLSAVVLVVLALVRGIRRRDLWIPVLTVGCFVASFLLVVLECKATYYRSAQFLPLVCAFGALLLIYSVLQLKKQLVARKWQLVLGTWLQRLMIVCFGILLFNQCSDMNKWFYVDYLKYEDAKTTMNRIAYELAVHYDNTKPVIFTGGYRVPQSIVENAFVEYGSDEAAKIERAAGLLGEDVIKNFYTAQGIWVAQTPALSVLDWAATAFGDDREMANFYEFHGQQLVPERDRSKYEAAFDYASSSMPHFPEQGYIQDMGDYIIVNY